MKVLYSTQAVVQFDGKHYYSNAVQSTYPRYKVLGDHLVCLAYIKHVDSGTEDKVDEGALEFVEIAKINTLSSFFLKRRDNDIVVEKEVKKADVCVAHIPSFHSEAVVKYAKKYSKPYMTVVVGCSWDSYWNYNLKGKILAPFCYLSLRNAQKNAPFSIYVTNHFLQNRYPTTGKWIGCSNVNISTGINGVLESRMCKIREKAEEKKVLKIGTAAALDVPYKGQLYVIQALSLLKKQGFDYEYHLVGAGTGEALKQAAIDYDVEDRIFIKGRIPHEKITDFLDEIDIYIQPSKQEGLPRATIEAMSRGCLCLGSDIAGIPELIEKRYLFKKGNYREIAKILASVSLEDLVCQAERNYNLAKEYDADVLNARRMKFILEFRDSFIS